MKNLFKKIGALLVAAVMVLSMCTAVFADEQQETPVASTASLTVQGLVSGETTTVEVYKVVEWDAANSSWKLVNDEIAGMVDFNTNPVTFNWGELAKNKNMLVKVRTEQVTDSTVTFQGLEIGAYYVYAQSEKTTYNPMGEAVYAYDETTGLMKPANKIIDAKGSTYTLTKAFTGDDGQTTYQVVNRGQEVPFTITATFPSYDKEATDRAFQITDEPTGMKVTEVTVKVGEDTLTAGNYKLVSVKDDGSDDKEITLPAAENQKVRVRFSPNYIGSENKHAGQTVTVEVKAQITDADTFVNKASSDKGSKPSEVNGKLGSITINKYDENYDKENVTGKLLAGAEFSIAQDKKKIQFVHVVDEEGKSIYKKATAEEIADNNITKVENIVAKNGVVVAKGLDDGTYQIVEEKAPAGYSVVKVDDVTIANGENPTATVDVSDTKLHSLPHTDTAIFTNPDLCPHSGKIMAKPINFRFTGAAVKDCFPLCKDRCQNALFCSAYTSFLKRHLCTSEFSTGCPDHPAVFHHSCPKAAQNLDMKIHRPLPDHTASGISCLCLFAPPQHCSH